MVMSSVSRSEHAEGSVAKSSPAFQGAGVNPGKLSAVANVDDRLTNTASSDGAKLISRLTWISRVASVPLASCVRAHDHVVQWSAFGGALELDAFDNGSRQPTGLGAREECENELSLVGLAGFENGVVILLEFIERRPNAFGFRWLRMKRDVRQHLSNTGVMAATLV